MPLWVKSFSFIWQNVEQRSALMGDLMFSSWKIKAIANFEPPSTMIDAVTVGHTSMLICSVKCLNEGINPAN